ncbi:MAG: hypothetical protein Sv326_0422 [Candidatus Fermentimicrarchaeum limneticum]|uniref:SpoVT-AbrB domain-containing protein n=1 Tax=Fermentimicrarchaeum limneticum TaxID=2795018 RepID=A0A7D6BF67_FERL1|nr:MAG: hypothetical protein Sv326_0348 [Candidatus Fermentimicrarchaeum limneticum]QLJ52560.1 MAG: hypothetical protein Sv326_0385 [Candidatus Fermentimicrarchaeum limneticum]QLJ52597.1 MAG: hypothetical protein Sv326_0422 [Candidatus Fermentimicrarchaeum limneticum]
MPEKYADITSIFVDSEGAGRFYLSTKIVEELKIKSGEHFKVIVDNGRIIFERVE